MEKKKDLEACPLLSVSISVQVPLETQEMLDMAFVGHSSLSLPLDLSSQRQFSQVVDHCLDHFSLKYYVLVT